MFAAVPISARRPSRAALEALLLSLADKPLTYPEVGATGTSTLPSGYRHDRYRVVIGRSGSAFERGREGIRTWQAHRHVGATLVPVEPAITLGTDLIVVVPVGPVWGVVPCRVVDVTDTDEAYGTLPGHPERGEEAFRVRREPEGVVIFEVVVFSKPADPLARLGGPLSRLIQTRTTKGYLEGIRSYVNGTERGEWRP